MSQAIKLFGSTNTLTDKTKNWGKCTESGNSSSTFSQM